MQLEQKSACRLPRGHIGYSKPTELISNAGMIPHRGDLDVAPTIGAFDGGQHAHVH